MAVMMPPPPPISRNEEVSQTVHIGKIFGKNKIVANANICNIVPDIASVSTGLRPHLSDSMPNGTVMRILGMQSAVACHPCNMAK